MVVSRDKMAEDAVKKQTCLQCRKRKVSQDTATRHSEHFLTSVLGPL